MHRMSEPQPAATTAARARTGDSRAHIVLSVALPNALTMLLAIVQHWSLDAMLWPYWLQLVINGAFNHLRMRRAANLPVRPSSRKYVDPPPKELKRGQVSLPTFFCVHYGVVTLFALVLMPDSLPSAQGSLLIRAAILFALLPRYPLLAAALGAVLWHQDGITASQTTIGILASAAGFAAMQAHAYFTRRAIDEQLGYGLTGVLLFAPYARLAPMYLFCMIAAFMAPHTNMPELLALFVLIKSVIEYFSWGLEQRMLKSIGLDEPD